MKNLLSLLVLVGCGTQAQESQKEVEKSTVLPSATVPSVSVAQEKVAHSFVIASLTDLEKKKCDELNEGQIAYVASEKLVMTCTDKSWISLELKGSDGKDGLNGTNGLNGTQGIAGIAGVNGSNGLNGATGAQGIQGVAGATGAQGVAGTNGTNGTNGASGLSALPTLYNSSGVAIAKAAYFDSTAGMYGGYTLASNLRVQVSAYGLHSYFEIFYTGSNCSGTGRVKKHYSQWENVFLWDGLSVPAIHRKKTTFQIFNAFSKRTPFGSCQNISSTNVTGWNTVTLTPSEQAEIPVTDGNEVTTGD